MPSLLKLPSSRPKWHRITIDRLPWRREPPAASQPPASPSRRRVKRPTVLQVMIRSSLVILTAYSNNTAVFCIILQVFITYEFSRRRRQPRQRGPRPAGRPTGRAVIGKQEMAAASSGAPKYRVIYNWDGAPHGYGAPPQSMESFLDATFAPLTNTHCDGARRPSPHEVCFTAAGLCRSPPPRNPTTPTHTLARTRTRSRVALAAGR